MKIPFEAPLRKSLKTELVIFGFLIAMFCLSIEAPPLARGGGCPQDQREILFSDAQLDYNNATDYLLGKYNTWKGFFKEEEQAIDFDSNSNGFFMGILGTDFGLQYDIFLGKVDASGEPVWFKSWGLPTKDLAYDIAVESEGSKVFVCGQVFNLTSSPYSDMLLLCFDGGTGQGIWNCSWGERRISEKACSLIVTSDKIVVVGTSYLQDSPASDSDILLVCFNKTTGSELWSKTFDTNFHDFEPKIVLDQQQHLFLSFNRFRQTLRSDGFSNEFFLQRLTIDGNKTWELNEGLEKNTKIKDLTINQVNQTIILTGQIKEEENEFSNDFAIFLYDFDGNFLRQFTSGDPNKEDIALAIAVDSQGKIIVSGYSETGFRNAKVAFLSKFDSQGHIIWTGEFQSYFQSMITDLAINSENKILLTGSCQGEHEVFQNSFLVGMTYDADDDGVCDLWEIQQGTDPNNPDTDGDGWNEGEEYHFGTDPLNRRSNPSKRRFWNNFGVGVFFSLVVVFLIINFFVSLLLDNKKGQAKTSELGEEIREKTPIVKLYDKIISLLKRETN